MKNQDLPNLESNTLNGMLDASVRQYPGNRLACTRKSITSEDKQGRLREIVTYEPVTYHEFAGLVRNWGAGLISLGLKEKEAVCVVAENSLRWLVADFAVLGNRAYNIPCGTGIADKEIEYVIGHAEARFVFVADEKVLARVQNMKERLSCLEYIIVLDKGFTALDEKNKLYSYDFVHSLGEQVPVEVKELFRSRCEATLPEDLATIMYTSGTTGTPKGIPLTHANFMHNATSLAMVMHEVPADKFLSILPIWHAFERSLEYTILRAGASIWYTSQLTILKDLEVVKPTHLVSIPRIWLLVYNGFMKKLQRRGKLHLFQTFYRHSLKVMQARRYKAHRQYLHCGEEPVPCHASLGDYFFHWLGDLLIYSKVRKITGKNFKLGISGGGSLPEYVDDFFEIIGITLIEGYGLTETSPVLCVRTYENRRPYTVGLPLPETNLKILDQEGREITGSQPGVLWVNGPQVFSGYYKNPEATAKVFMKDEQNRVWFNTGDLVKRTGYGDITIIGRVKETIVLITGENVEPAKIEAALLSSEYIEQVMLCGQDQEFITALIVPALEPLELACRKLNIPFDKEKIDNGLLKNQELKKIYQEIIAGLVSRGTGFKETELIHDFAFTRPFTVSDGTFTNTLKIKRFQVVQRDKNIIESMYPHYHHSGKAKV